MMSLKNQRNGDNINPPKIVVADDKYLNIELLHMKFKSVALDPFAVFCQDGQVAINECIKIVNESLLTAKFFPVTPIAILILDINMPVKTGVQALTEIMDYYDKLQVPSGIDAHNFIKKPHLIMMSSYRQPQISNIIQDKGVKDFFQSPLGKIEVNRIIQIYSKYNK